jgi:hypothetical protein
MATDEQKRVFLELIIAEGRKIGVSLSHEDVHGGFVIDEYHDDLANWLREALRNRVIQKFAPR